MALQPLGIMASSTPARTPPGGRTSAPCVYLPDTHFLDPERMKAVVKLALHGMELWTCSIISRRADQLATHLYLHKLVKNNTTCSKVT